jgi:hypothetical protein
MSACALVAGTAVYVALGLQFSGGYYALAGGIVGVVAVVAAGAGLIGGLRPSRGAVLFAGLISLLGIWSALSTAWDAVPQVSWRFLGLTVTAAAAAVAGSCLAGVRRGQELLLLGVGAGIAGHAAYVLGAVGTHSAPDDWFDGRQVSGPVGYHNAEAAAVVLGVPVALWYAGRRTPWQRAVGAAAATLLLGVTLMTQSRGALLAFFLSAAIQAAVSRRLRIAAVGAALAVVAAVLFLPLRSVDRALVDQSFDDRAFTRFALAVVACAVVTALLSVPEVQVRFRPTRRQVATTAGVAVAVLLVVAGLSAAALGDRVHRIYHRLTVEPNQTAHVAGGETRLASISLTGRKEQWRIALEMAGEHPLQGSGTGTFSRRWGIDRPFDNLYVLQPHSLELEMLAELGIVGLALLAGAFATIGRGVAAGAAHRRSVAAAAAGGGVAFLLQASVDWIFSFPGLLVPLFLLLGAAARGAPGLPERGRTGASMAAVVAAVLVLAGPALASFELSRSRDDGPERFAASWSHVSRALDFDRWDPEAVSYQGSLAEANADYRLAASLYEKAATLSQQPWVEHYRQARALRSAGLVAASRAVCRAIVAEDPLDRSLRGGVCEDAS